MDVFVKSWKKILWLALLALCCWNSLLYANDKCTFCQHMFEQYKLKTLISQSTYTELLIKRNAEAERYLEIQSLHPDPASIYTKLLRKRNAEAERCLEIQSHPDPANGFALSCPIDQIVIYISEYNNDYFIDLFGPYGLELFDLSEAD